VSQKATPDAVHGRTACNRHAFRRALAIADAGTLSTRRRRGISFAEKGIRAAKRGNPMAIGNAKCTNRGSLV